MYRVQDQPDSTAVLDNGVDLSPLVTLRDDFGGVAHIIEEDHCYVLTINGGRTDGRVQRTAWWFREAWESARQLPLLTAP